MSKRRVCGECRHWKCLMGKSSPTKRIKACTNMASPRCGGHFDYTDYGCDFFKAKTDA